MWVRFLKDAIYETEGPGQGPRFEAGSEHDMRDDLGRRWVNRGLAVEIAQPTPAAAPPKRQAAERAVNPATRPQPIADNLG